MKLALKALKNTLWKSGIVSNNPAYLLVITRTMK